MDDTQKLKDLDRYNPIAHTVPLSKLSRAYPPLIYSTETIKILERLTKGGLDLDYAVPPDSPAAQRSPELIGSTPLHFAAQIYDEQIVDYFIQYGAKITAVNELGYSPIRLALQENFIINQNTRLGYAAVDLDKLLNAQYNQNDASNPSCKEGISHLHIACMVNNFRMVEFLLRFGASVDAAISQDSCKMAGFRPLHVAVYYRAVDSLKILLKSGADLFAHEARGLNPLQLLVEMNLRMSDQTAELRAFRNHGISLELICYSAHDRMADSLLEHCADNFCNEYGFDRLHIVASMSDNTKLVDLLKSNPGINVNAVISTSSPLCPGYTPLHFAARCGYNAVKLLLEKGANLLIADAKGTTPFDICVTRYKPEILYEIMQFDETLKSITFKTSPLATLCEAINALQSTEHMYKFRNKMNHIDDPLPCDSPLWPGCTLLHLAVAVGHQRLDSKYRQQLSDEFDKYTTKKAEHRREESYNFIREIDLWRYLTAIGANPLAQDIRNSSPVHLAFRRYNTDTVKYLLQELIDKFKPFDNIVDLDGLSLLHISAAVGLGNVAVSLLENNADVNIRTISEIKFMWGVTEYCLPPRSTPLHIAASTNCDIIGLLVKEGAELSAIDAAGFTPVLRTFIRDNVFLTYPRKPIIFDSFFSFNCTLKYDALLEEISRLKTNVVCVGGLSHLHVACWWNCATAVEAFLNQGADVNAKIINCDPDDLNNKCTWTHYLKELLFKKYAGYTPLHFAVEFESLDVIKLLMESGADLHARNARGLSPLHLALMSYSNSAGTIIECLTANINKFKCKPLDDYGITLLHIACRIKNKHRVRLLLLKGSDVNAQIAMHSPIWPGDTPLHVLTGVLFKMNEDYDIARLLIKHGADITLSNIEENTPLHVLSMNLVNQLDKASELYNIYLRNKLKYYSVNRTNKDGLTFFHIACLANNINIVMELLSHGADVNQPVDYFAKNMAGLRPLHFATMAGNPKMLRLLIKEGANLSAEDTDGKTIFHYFCKYVKGYTYFARMIPIFCQLGLDINAHDFTGVSPINVLVQRYAGHDETENDLFPPIEYEKIAVCLLKFGARLNSLNSSMPYLVKVALTTNLRVDFFLRNAKDSDILAVLDDGSTAIHNTVRSIVEPVTCYKDEMVDTGIIMQLLKRGCSINAQDNCGRTALHIALYCGNTQGIYELVEAGIDPNIVDNDGKNFWNIEDGYEGANHILINYLHKFALLGLEMSESNRRDYSFVLVVGFVSLDKDSENELKLIKELNEPIGGFLLSEILSESIISKYAALPRVNREDILHKLASPDLHKKFHYLSGPIEYQYQRLLERIKLAESAKNVLEIVLGKLLPVLCLDRIISFLSNAELRILIR